MVAPSKKDRSRKPVPKWHAGFMKLLPKIRLAARIAFRHRGAEAKAECVQQVICNAMAAYRRLFQLGKLNVAHAGPLSRFAIAQTKDGRITGGHQNVLDVLSQFCQKRKNVAMQRLDKFNRFENEWEEVLVEDRRAGPFDIARMRLDFASFLSSLPLRLRRIAKFLAKGESTTAAAEKFGVSMGRISQIRRELAESWRKFVGDEPGDAAAVAA